MWEIKNIFFITTDYPLKILNTKILYILSSLTLHTNSKRLQIVARHVIAHLVSMYMFYYFYDAYKNVPQNVNKNVSSYSFHY